MAVLLVPLHVGRNERSALAPVRRALTAVKVLESHKTARFVRFAYYGLRAKLVI
jgi:hypothetical protein